MKIKSTLQVYITAIRDFQAAHRAWFKARMTEREEPANQYRNSCLARLSIARRDWERENRKYLAA